MRNEIYAMRFAMIFSLIFSLIFVSWAGRASADNVITFPAKRKCVDMLYKQPTSLWEETRRIFESQRFRTEGGNVFHHLSNSISKADGLTFERLFVGHEGYENMRTFSPLSQNIKFGIGQALGETGSGTVAWSGFPQKFLFGRLRSRGWKFATSESRINHLIVLGKASAAQFVKQSIGEENLYGNLFSLKENLDISLSEDESSAQLSSPMLPKIEYTHHRSASKFSGKVDAIIDYGGLSASETDLGKVIALYNDILKVGGYLLLSLPLRQVKGETESEFSTFALKGRHERRAIEGDQFFSRIPGFELINAYSMNSPLVYAMPTSRGQSLVENYLLEKNFDGEWQTLVVILKKVRNSKAEITQAVSTAYTPDLQVRQMSIRALSAVAD